MEEKYIVVSITILEIFRLSSVYYDDNNMKTNSTQLNSFVFRTREIVSIYFYYLYRSRVGSTQSVKNGKQN